MAPTSETYKDAVGLLCRLVSTPSTSRNESDAATLVQEWLAERGVEVRRCKNNVWALGKYYRPGRPTVMLNSHIDTVKPQLSYSFDPYSARIEDGKIYGLGSNDAGGSVVSLASVFALLNDDNSLPYNIMLAFSAEEEVSGENGMRSLLPELAANGIEVDMAIVGEPTSMQPAVAERGLLVLDCTAHGKSGHAARNEGVNALYKAVDDINKLRELRFPKESATLGPIKVSVTQIQAGTQHNVVPDTCTFVVDVRTTDACSNEETERLIQEAIHSEVKARSYRIRASVISKDHPLVRAAVALGKKPFVSPTTSDMALMSFPTLKIGPGDSARSHTADEFIYEAQIIEAIDTYYKILKTI